MLATDLITQNEPCDTLKLKLLADGLVEGEVRPMTNDYNSNSTHQTNANVLANNAITAHAKKLAQIFPGELIIGDFGCSHGRNSMDSVKAALDGYLDSPTATNLNLYFIDLPSNDFQMVRDCINDPKISYKSHELLMANLAPNALENFVGGNFYNTCVPEDHLNLAFSFNCLHWLKRSINLSRALVHGSTLMTIEEKAELADLAHTSLVDFFMCRSKELKVGGKLVCHIMQEFQAFDSLDEPWVDFIESKQLDLTRFVQCSMPLCFRSNREIIKALNEVSESLQVDQYEGYTTDVSSWSTADTRCTMTQSVVCGLMRSNYFSSETEAASFFAEFLTTLPPRTQPVLAKFHLLVLQRI